MMVTVVLPRMEKHRGRDLTGETVYLSLAMGAGLVWVVHHANVVGPETNIAACITRTFQTLAAKTSGKDPVAMISRTG